MERMCWPIESVPLQQCQYQGDKIVRRSGVCGAMLAFEITDFIKQQIEQEEWQEEEEMAKVHIHASPSHRSTHWASPSGSIAYLAALSIDFIVFYFISSGENMPCTKLKWLEGSKSAVIKVYERLCLH